MEQRFKFSLSSTIAAGSMSFFILFCFWLWKSGCLSSQQSMMAALKQFGVLAPLAFIVLQIVQVVIPIMPGGVSCLVGVLMFGAWKGFLYNCIGICIGSVAAFLLARKYGMPLIRQLFSEKTINKYQHWTQENNRFTKLFAAAVFLPAAPDDLLCFLAGTTAMPLRVFTWIILSGKPGAIALYSLTLKGIFRTLFPSFLR